MYLSYLASNVGDESVVFSYRSRLRTVMCHYHENWNYYLLVVKLHCHHVERWLLNPFLNHRVFRCCLYQLFHKIVVWLWISTIAPGSCDSEDTDEPLRRFSITWNSSLKKESTSSLLKNRSLPLFLHLVYNLKYILDR